MAATHARIRADRQSARLRGRIIDRVDSPILIPSRPCWAIRKRASLTRWSARRRARHSWRAALSPSDSHCGLRRLAFRNRHDDRSPPLAASPPRLGDHRTRHGVVPRVFSFRPTAFLTRWVECVGNGLRIGRRSGGGSRIGGGRCLDQCADEQRRSDAVNDNAWRDLRMSVVPRSPSSAEPSARPRAVNTTRRRPRAVHADQHHAFSAPPAAGTPRLKGVVCPRSPLPAARTLPASDVDNR